MNASCSSFVLHKKKNVWRMSLGVLQPEERSFCITFRGQRGEYTVAWVGVAFIILCSLRRHLTSLISLRLVMGTSDLLGSFNHLLQTSPGWGHAQTMSVCNVSSLKHFLSVCTTGVYRL